MRKARKLVLKTVDAINDVVLFLFVAGDSWPMRKSRVSPRSGRWGPNHLLSYTGTGIYRYIKECVGLMHFGPLLRRSDAWIGSFSEC